MLSVHSDLLFSLSGLLLSVDHTRDTHPKKRCTMFDSNTPSTPSGPTGPLGLFQGSEDVTASDASDFAPTSLAVIHELLDDAVMHGEMSGTRAWLVQQLVSAREAAVSHSLLCV